MNPHAILIPAAGASHRMAPRDKLLELVDGIPLLRRQALRALETGAAVLVTLPALDHPRAAAVEGLSARLVPVPDAATGMAASIRRGVACVPPGVRGLVILPADMPDIAARDIAALLDHFEAEDARVLVQATGDDGTPGHPVIFPADCFAALAQVAGDAGGRAVVQANRHRLVRVPLAGPRALTDLDTPAAWSSWRAANPGS
ncbi:nucleotidyltransferase family protein [Citreimonas salinaria]|uniref:CTP:molybdopterin cytidylyltransferase MocA n=1 Tax=Citreimonas salinaria TaxID=321339 RepID=A0A1H3GHF2_9RHOB|nr:nucleotidyltransferase family protein [Citreimonas salinaria]SDY02480.1 CTP:molybdopterin cytidylyltransferase MocA [Citreimonas salinaria]